MAQSFGFVHVRPAADGVVVLSLEGGENRFNQEMIALLNKALDHIESLADVRVLMIAGKGKFFSNGLDLEKVAKPEVFPAFTASMYATFLRILFHRAVTIAVVNGHGFGVGFFLPLLCDHRIMNSDKGFMCAPELHLGLPLGPVFAEIAMTKLAPTPLRTAVLTGKRWTAAEAVQAGFVDFAVAEDKLLPTALGLAKALTKQPFSQDNYVTIKRELYGNIGKVLEANSKPKAKL